MTASFDHTITAAEEAAVSAAFFVDLLEAAEAPSWGPSTDLQLPDGVLLQFAAVPIGPPPQHDGFLLDDDHFDRARAHRPCS